ncbi:MAG: GntR family transcriptional regulator [Gammaproteobacteria bacterium]|nr:GntR family transcriptional regulator [Gammaproteobacteria bacterium]MDH3371932.1 GntR family transcriptional regulator [Gammaproteobacteria bacterium]MDH3407739.1 GntR family transcriptional regulator [Gammaproteobacteria bacterium]MDH3551678.1 GntR family transcriptional regulator [Gammaproteobacteria bacterium]
MASIPIPSTVQTLADQVFEALQSAIITGDLKPGEKLREPELARRFGTSRGPLRDALRRLEGRHLVTNTPNTGARVVSLSHGQLLDLYHVREALEGMTCRLAAEHMTDSEVDELASLLDRHESEIQRKEGAEYFQQEGDLDFHFRIANGCKNDLLRSALCEDHYQLMRLYRYKFSSRLGRPRRALEEHRMILGAIRDRDGELAELLMRRHIRNARKMFEKNLEGDLAKQDATKQDSVNK